MTGCCGDCAQWDYDTPRREWTNIVRPAYVAGEGDEDEAARAVAVNEPWGQCAAPAFSPDDRDLDPETRMIVQDGSGYCASLYTHRDFGCVLFRPKTDTLEAP